MKISANWYKFHGFTLGAILTNFPEDRRCLLFVYFGWNRLSVEVNYSKGGTK